MAYLQHEYNQYFDQKWVSLPLKKGDAVFFNPAIYYAAGENQSRMNRSSLLLQVNSAFGKPMEKVNNLAILQACRPSLKELRSAGDRNQETDAALRAICLRYRFPTNLDRRPPVQ